MDLLPLAIEQCVFALISGEQNLALRAALSGPIHSVMLRFAQAALRVGGSPLSHY